GVGGGGGAPPGTGGGGGGVGGLARRGIERVLDDDLLLGVDHEPDIGPHDAPDDAAEKDDPRLRITEAPLADPPVPQIRPARQETEPGGPSKPPHGAGEKLLLSTAACGGFRLGEDRRPDEIEVI